MAVSLVPEYVIKTIAEYSNTTAAHAGVGACEIAGMVISVLSVNPELIPDFLDNPSGTVMDNLETFRWENRSLSWHAVNGDIVSPSEMRAHLGRADC